jgi:hypothetical protein
MDTNDILTILKGDPTVTLYEGGSVLTLPEKKRLFKGFNAQHDTPPDWYAILTTADKPYITLELWSYGEHIIVDSSLKPREAVIASPEEAYREFESAYETLKEHYEFAPRTDNSNSSNV